MTDTPTTPIGGHAELIQHDPALNQAVVQAQAQAQAVARHEQIRMGIITRRAKARSTGSTIGTINIVLLVLNIIGTVIFSVVTIGLALVPCVLATIATWVTLAWFQHTLLMLADVSENTER